MYKAPESPEADALLDEMLNTAAKREQMLTALKGQSFEDGINTWRQHKGMPPDPDLDDDVTEIATATTTSHPE